MKVNYQRKFLIFGLILLSVGIFYIWNTLRFVQIWDSKIMIPEPVSLESNPEENTYLFIELMIKAPNFQAPSEVKTPQESLKVMILSEGEKLVYAVPFIQIEGSTRTKYSLALMISLSYQRSQIFLKSENSKFSFRVKAEHICARTLAEKEKKWNVLLKDSTIVFNTRSLFEGYNAVSFKSTKPLVWIDEEELSLNDFTTLLSKPWFVSFPQRSGVYDFSQSTLQTYWIFEATAAPTRMFLYEHTHPAATSLAPKIPLVPFEELYDGVVAEALAGSPPIYSLKENPRILVLISPDRLSQEQYFGGLNYFLEIKNYVGKLLKPSQRMAQHSRPAYDWSDTGLASYYQKAQEDEFILSSQEQQLKEYLIKHNILDAHTYQSLYNIALLGYIPFGEEYHYLLRHEIWHGLYFTMPQYRSIITQQWKQTSSAEKEFWFQFLDYLRYDVKNQKKLLIHEWASYLLHHGDDSNRVKISLKRYFSVLGIPEQDDSKLLEEILLSKKTLEKELQAELGEVIVQKLLNLS